MKPVLLDLFCGAGGATAGYQRAGFCVIGVDIEPQPNYCGDHFIQADAIEMLECLAKDKALFCGPGLTILHPDAIHASPPCQNSSALKALWRDRDHPELIPPTRELLAGTGLPYAIENVVGAKLIEPTKLCGSAFGLGVRRHRLFETNFPLMSPGCAHGLQRWAVPVYGHSGAGVNRGRERDRGRKNGVAEWRSAMDIDWMSRDELAQAIPPAYTEWIGHRLAQHLALDGAPA